MLREFYHNRDTILFRYHLEPDYEDKDHSIIYYLENFQSCKLNFWKGQGDLSSNIFFRPVFRNVFQLKNSYGDSQSRGLSP